MKNIFFKQLIMLIVWIALVWIISLISYVLIRFCFGKADLTMIMTWAIGANLFLEVQQLKNKHGA